jgi:hypothetical protein
MYLKEKPIPNQKEKYFIVGHYIIFSDLKKYISYEPQT